MGVLDGIRVVEMGLWVAGPAAGGIMADWGAEVIKVEATSGDPMRKLFGALSGSKEERCPPFDTHNRGKRSVALDINTPEGRDLTERIIAGADVFLTNMRPAFLARAGLDHQQLLQRHPRLVYASLTGYGLDGPDKDAPGYDVAAFSARSGVADRSSPEGEAPPTLPGGFGDAVTGIATVAAVLAGLLHRDRTGEGQLVSTSLLRTGVYCIGMDVATRLSLDRLAPSVPRTSPQNPMLNSYEAGDGKWLWLIGAEATRHWPGLVAALGDPSIGEDERFKTPRDRRRNATALVDILDRTFAQRPRSEWAQRFAEHDVWWAPVNSVEDLLTDEQVRAAGTFVPVRGPDGSTGEGIAMPATFSAAPDGPKPAPPAVGADTDAVLADLGVPADELQRLHEAGVLGGPVSSPLGQRS